MIKLQAKASLARLKRKVKQWESAVDEESLRDLRLYGAEASKAMMKCTPPGNMRTTPAKALTKLKQRIKQDMEGDGLVPFDDDDIFWFTSPTGQRMARIGGYNGGRPSPFRVVSGRVTKKMLAAMNVGRYRVQFIKGDLGTWMRKNDSDSLYYMTESGRNTFRLGWRGTRHVTTMASVRAEIRRRQHLAGKLMAGWKPLAHKAGAKLPAAVERQTGRGSATLRRSSAHKAVLHGRNAGHYPRLQVLVDRQVPYIRRRAVSIARKRIKNKARKMMK